jgi:hypothetical protein
MRLAAVVALVLLGAVVLGVVPLAPGALAQPSTAPVTSPISGNLTGPSLVSTGSNGTFYLNVTGGPAVVEGSFVGTINWTANLTGPNTTGTSVSPSNGSISNSTSQPVSLTVKTGAVAESLTLTVHVTSAIATTSKQTNFTTTFQLVPPYTVRATLLTGPNAGTLPFNVSVSLDGTVVGSVPIPKLSPNETYGVLFLYPSTGLSSGYHTFTLSVADVHGLVTFTDGKTVQSTTFYVASPAPNNTIWYVVGVVAFFGVLFIYATRGAARRRGSARR